MSQSEDVEDVAARAREPLPGGSDPAAGQRRRPRDRVTQLHGHGSIDPHLLGELLALARTDGLPVGIGPIRVRRLLTDRSGQVAAADARPLPLITLHRHVIRQQHRQLNPGALLSALLADLPGPPPTVDSYRPSAAQRWVVNKRDGHCTFPGCGRPAGRADSDHPVRYDPDGNGTGDPTSIANLHALCRRHHRLKHDGWTVRRHPGGATTWTSPRGHRHRKPPD